MNYTLYAYDLVQYWAVNRCSLTDLLHYQVGRVASMSMCTCDTHYLMLYVYRPVSTYRVYVYIYACVY